MISFLVGFATGAVIVLFLPLSLQYDIKAQVRKVWNKVFG